MKHVATLPPKDRESAIAGVVRVLSAFAPGKPINVKVSIARPERSPWQLRYVRGVAVPLLAEAQGFAPETLYEWLCGQWFGWRTRKVPPTPTNPAGLESVPLRTTTTDEDGNRDVIDGDAFWQFVEFIQRTGAEAGVVIPDPDPEKAANPRRSKWKRAA